jgi:septin family protein
VKVCDTNSNLVSGKDIILVMGTIGAGKSTSIQYLYGGNMVKSEEGHIQARPMPKKLKSLVASAAMKSETRYINPIDFEYTNLEGKKIKLMIVDTPGFGDTQSIEVDISNSIGIIKAVREANSVYPVFIFH